MTAKNSPAPAAPISAAERRRRQKAVDFARASVGLSGFKVSAEEQARMQRFVDGEIELADMLNAPHEKHRE